MFPPSDRAKAAVPVSKADGLAEQRPPTRCTPCRRRRFSQSLRASRIGAERCKTRPGRRAESPTSRRYARCVEARSAWAQPTPSRQHDSRSHPAGIGFKVLTGQGATIDTTKPAGKLVFGIFAALAEFERELMSERTKAGLASARARGRKGGAPFKMTAAKLRLAMSAMSHLETHVGDLCRELGVTRQTLYRHVGPDGSLRRDGRTILN